MKLTHFSQPSTPAWKKIEFLGCDGLVLTGDALCSARPARRLRSR
jgi:hypothetical protein